MGYFETAERAGTVWTLDAAHDAYRLVLQREQEPLPLAEFVAQGGRAFLADAVRN